VFCSSSHSCRSLLLEKAHLGDQAARLAIPDSTTKMDWVPLSYHFTSPAFVSPTHKGLLVCYLDFGHSTDKLGIRTSCSLQTW